MVFYQPQVESGYHFLDEEESSHCARVLRKRAGDQVEVRDGKGNIYHVRLTEVHPRKCSFEIIRQQFVAEDPFHIHLALAPTKNADRMEWMVEKCVEIGLHELTFLSCDHSERSRIRFDRLKKKAISAMKQSRRAYALSLHEQMVPFNTFVTESIANTPAALAHVSEDQPHLPLKQWHPASSCIILIGPEGDFSPQEVALATSHEIPLVNLGSNRLRTETAGLIAVHTMLLHFQ